MSRTFSGMLKAFMFVDSVKKDSLFSSLENLQVLYLPLLKRQAFVLPLLYFFPFTISPLSYFGILLRVGNVIKVISVPRMGKSGSGLWIIIHRWHSALCFIEPGTLLFFFFYCFNGVNCCFNNEFNFV